MGGEGVTQRVRRDALRQARLPRRALDDGPRPDAGQRGAPGIEKQDASALPFVEARADLARVQGHRTKRASAGRDETLLRALAEDAGQAVLVQDVLDPERDELRDARPRGVRQLEQRAVAARERLGVRGREQPLHLGHREHAREAPPLAR